MNKLFILVVVLIFFSFGFAQKTKNPEIKKINNYVKGLSSFVNKKSAKLEIFADASQTKKPGWKRFPSEKSLEKFRETTETDEMAYVWRKNGKEAVVNFTFTSESGDWANYVNHYFREDGTVAKVESELRTFNGEISIVQDYYFDRTGKLLKKTVQYRDLQTSKPIKPTKEVIENNKDFTSEVNYYKKTSKLPFAYLLRKKKKRFYK